MLRCEIIELFRVKIYFQKNLKEKIKYISRKNLSIEKYDRCIQQAENSLVYAYSWFLDSVADDWGVLILHDYKVVMPIPYLKLKRNLFAKRIYQPDFCQQLGIFSSAFLSQEEALSFFETFLSLKPRSYSFNYYDTKHFLKERFKLKERINYELDLNNLYKELASNYSTNIKRNLKKANQSELQFTNTIAFDTFIKFKKEETHYKTKSKQLKIMQQLVKTAIKQGFGEIYGILKDEKLLAVAFILNDKRRLISLITATNDLGKKLGAIAFLNDNLIKEHSETKIILDFEGSMISGIARFYKSFGAEVVNYLSY